MKGKYIFTAACGLTVLAFVFLFVQRRDVGPVDRVSIMSPNDPRTGFDSMSFDTVSSGKRLLSPSETYDRESTAAKSQAAPFVTELDTINVRDFNVVGNGQNETAAFQEALNASVGKILYIPKQRGDYYLLSQIKIPSKVNIICDSEVIIQASDKLRQHHPDFEVLFRIEDVSDVVIRANGAIFRMNKNAYRGEHNHIFMINGSSNITIVDANANDSGGDGFYVGAFRTIKGFSSNIKLINCKANNNRRQGLSITSVDGFLAEQCAFNNTSGASPASGVDIEPNNNNEKVKNIRFVDCEANGNQRRGFMVQLSKITKALDEISIVFANCKAIDNTFGFACMYFNDNVPGTVRFINCRAENSKYAAFIEESCSALGARKVYSGCIAYRNNISKSNAKDHSNSSSFYIFESSVKSRSTIGNSEFINCSSIGYDNNDNSTVRYGLSVATLGKAEPRNIIVDRFKSEGHSEAALQMPVGINQKRSNITIRN